MPLTGTNAILGLDPPRQVSPRVGMPPLALAAVPGGQDAALSAVLLGALGAVPGGVPGPARIPAAVATNERP
jgi:hypothetical protein